MGILLIFLLSWIPASWFFLLLSLLISHCRNRFLGLESYYFHLIGVWFWGYFSVSLVPNSLLYKISFVLLFPEFPFFLMFSKPLYVSTIAFKSFPLGTCEGRVPWSNKCSTEQTISGCKIELNKPSQIFIKTVLK